MSYRVETCLTLADVINRIHRENACSSTEDSRCCHGKEPQDRGLLSDRSIRCLFWENLQPIVFHIHNHPTAFSRLVQTTVESAKRRAPIVGHLTLVVRMVKEEAESRAGTASGVFQHLEVTVGISERKDGPSTDEFMDTNRLACFIINHVNLGQTHQGWTAIAQRVLYLNRAADNLLRRNPVDLGRPRSHELDTPPRRQCKF